MDRQPSAASAGSGRRTSRTTTRNGGRAAVALIGAVLTLLAGCQVEITPPESSSSGSSSLRDRTAADDFGSLLDDVELAAGEASLARNFYFIIDGSGSMKSPPRSPCTGDRFDSKLEGARWAVQSFLRKIPDGVNIGLYLFDQRGAREVVPLGTDNRGEFLHQVDAIAPGRGTPLAAAIRFGSDQMVAQYKRQLGYGEYRLVVVTDGKADGIPEAAEYSDRWGMPIYAIGLCIEEDHPLRRHAVSYRAADSFQDLEKGLEETLAELPSFDVTDFQTEAE